MRKALGCGETSDGEGKCREELQEPSGTRALEVFNLAIRMQDREHSAIWRMRVSVRGNQKGRIASVCN